MRKNGKLLLTKETVKHLTETQAPGVVAGTASARCATANTCDASGCLYCPY